MIEGRQSVYPHLNVEEVWVELFEARRKDEQGRRGADGGKRFTYNMGTKTRILEDMWVFMVIVLPLLLCASSVGGIPTICK